MENKNNIEKIKQFLSIKENSALLINQVNEEIGSFYELAIKEISKENDIKISFNTDKINPDETSDLFQEERIYLYHLTNSKRLEEIAKKNYRKIIISDYKNFKKFQKEFQTINGYDYEKDMVYFFKNIYKINEQELINYCISHPYFTMSETTKYKINESSYLADSSIDSTNNFILDIRKSIFNLKRSQIDIKKLFMMLKNEVKYKKLNFLVF